MEEFRRHLRHLDRQVVRHSGDHQDGQERIRVDRDVRAQSRG